jgi:CBS domain-containing protein
VLIADVLKRKGAKVATIAQSATVRELVVVLVEEAIGSVVVISLAGAPVGIVSERDVIVHLPELGERLLDQSVDAIMSNVVSCLPSDTVDTVLETMTDRRIRHLPVVADEELVGVVSIGDLVKSRLDDLRHERDQMSDYISGSPSRSTG